MNTMLRIFPILELCRILADMSRIHVAPSIDLSTVNGHILPQSGSDLHFLDSVLKLKIARSLFLPEPTMLRYAVIAFLEAPIVEEVIYRGVGHFLGRLVATSNLVVSVWICRLLPIRLVASWDILAFVYNICVNFVSVKIWSSPVVFVFLASFGKDTLLFLPRIYLYKALQKSANKTHLVDHQNTRISFRKLFNLRALLQNSVLAKVGRKDRQHLHQYFDHVISWSARWKGAYNFGLAHAGQGVPIQKVLGTTLSSLFIESRLVIHRKTLWGAIGAHMAYNLSTHVRLLFHCSFGCFIHS